MSKIGILTLSSLNSYAKQVVNGLANENDIILSNKVSGVNADVLSISKDNKFNASSNIGHALAFINDLLRKYHYDQLLVISNRAIPQVIAYEALMNFSGQRTRFLYGKTVITPETAAKALAGKTDLMRKQRITFLKKDGSDDDKQVLMTESSSLNCLKTPNGATLRPYQQQLVDFILEKKRAGLFVDMGLGKTLSTLATINELNKQHKLDVTRPILIVAPIMVALDTWSREAEKWGYDFDVIINIHKTGKKRQELFEDLLVPKSKPTLLTTNPAQLGPLLKFLESKGQSDLFQVAIVDELSQFKSVKTNRFKQLTALTKQSEYFIGLTGTPAPNNLLDLYSEVVSIDPKIKYKLGYNFFQYRSDYFRPEYTSPTGVVYRWGLKPHSEQKIYDAVRSNVVSMKSEGLIDLPKIVFDNRYVTLPKKAHNIYMKLATKIRKQVAAAESKVNIKIDDEQDITIANSAVLTSKLLQLSSGAIYNDRDEIEADPDSSDYEVYQDEKFKMLKDIVDTSDSPILVFFYFKSELERMKKYFDFEYLDPSKPSEAKTLIKRWNKGEIPVLVAHPASAGHGLNLQDGGHIMVWLTLPWSNEQYRQSIKRLYRSGQTHPVSVIHIIAQDTVDEDVLQKLDLKEDGQSRLMNALER